MWKEGESTWKLIYSVKYISKEKAYSNAIEKLGIEGIVKFYNFSSLESKNMI